jgi:hypothetical protein
MNSQQIFGTQVVLSFVAYGLMARWYVSPRLARLPLEIALQPLLVLQEMVARGTEQASRFLDANDAVGRGSGRHRAIRQGWELPGRRQLPAPWQARWPEPQAVGSPPGRGRTLRHRG